MGLENMGDTVIIKVLLIIAINIQGLWTTRTDFELGKSTFLLNYPLIMYSLKKERVCVMEN